MIKQKRFGLQGITVKLKPIRLTLYFQLNQGIKHANEMGKALLSDV
ncbi:hypothetical protein VIN01S_17390 [Vibrio inusitatus NBRC 102082]|uniref:Uncharacterized protein n=1 Tax=Vibrio inusitatus NBRC 102082 TaxID=1219070 RepID=A0A4Y3HVB8_9VIBR|nr:hypothetical protein VIN01S_17390 [Vibrio inusitatus NBRC 102082]